MKNKDHLCEVTHSRLFYPMHRNQHRVKGIEEPEEYVLNERARLNLIKRLRKMIYLIKEFKTLVIKMFTKLRRTRHE